MSPAAINQYGELATSLGVIAGGIISAYYWVWPRFSKLWASYRERVKAKNDLPAKLDALIANQQANHESTTTKISAVAADVATLASITRARADANPHEANFEANAEGMLIAVNKTYTRWVNRELKEVLNHGWKNTVHPLDRDRVSEEWDQTVIEGRASNMKYRLLDGTLVEATATPIPEGVIPCERWVGVIRKVKEDELAVSHE